MTSLSANKLAMTGRRLWAPTARTRGYKRANVGVCDSYSSFLLSYTTLNTVFFLHYFSLDRCATFYKPSTLHTALNSFIHDSSLYFPGPGPVGCRIVFKYC
ncbi:hypothetical protein BT96DRAFT_500935 [Gymnopus androsaceus JB14]|uniref:Uncharacterized protein n=1 Tax=Gymnopus androsaceus JB14 TaxID=1447944 RepID=A0A6A4HXK3_9AGAR|nr:hypothetical protein BT96DRAFT_500935 [Gymnopus androsaceus JB14]